jgi:hypothetical protein
MLVWPPREREVRASTGRAAAPGVRPAEAQPADPRPLRAGPAVDQQEVCRQPFLQCIGNSWIEKVVLQNGGFCNGCITKRCFVTQQTIFFYQCSMMKDERTKRYIVVGNFLNDIWLSCEGNAWKY